MMQMYWTDSMTALHRTDTGRLCTLGVTSMVITTEPMLDRKRMCEQEHKEAYL